MSTYTGRTRTLSNNMGNFKTKKVFFSLFGPKQRTKRKAAQQLGLRLPSRSTQTHSPRFSRDSNSLPPFFRARTLCSAALQRVLKPKNRKTDYLSSRPQGEILEGHALSWPH